MPIRPQHAVAIAALFLAVTAPIFARSASAGWTRNGIRIDSLTSVALADPFVESDGQGGIIVSANVGLGPLWLSRVRADGSMAPGWPTTPALPNGFTSPAALDGQGGAFSATAYLDSVTVQHTLADGSSDPAWPHGGRSVCNGFGHRSPASLAPDGTGGVFVAWTETRRSGIPDGVRPRDLYVSRVLADGTRAAGWAPNGTLFATTSDTMFLAIGPCESDGDGGCYLTAARSSGGPYFPGPSHQELFLLHVGANAVLVPGWPVDGIGTAGSFSLLDHALIERGGCYTAFEHEQPGASTMWLKRVDASGGLVPGWPIEGVALTRDSTRLEGLAALTADDSGGVYVATERDTAGGLAPGVLELRRFDADGRPSAAWPANGVRIPAPPDSSYERVFELLPLRNGNVMALWSQNEQTQPPDARTLAALRIAAPGFVAPGWPASGIVVCDTMGYRRGPVLVNLDQDAVCAVWNDNRSGSPTGPAHDYAMRLDAPAVAAAPPHEASHMPEATVLASPNPFASRVRVRFALPGATSASVDVFDVHGRRIRNLYRGALATGFHDLEWNGRDDGDRATPPGLYFIRARGGAQAGVTRVLRMTP